MRKLVAFAAAILAAGPLHAVGLGPLVKQGITDGPDKAFYLTLINPYPNRTQFRVYAVGFNDENPADRVTLPMAEVPVVAQGQRRLLVIARGLEPGETYRFRVCAERMQVEGAFNVRVCSRLTARRLPARV